MNRINDQKKKLGKEGLKLCAERLSKAIHENTANKPSAEVLNALIVKELEKFNTFDISTTSNLQGEGRFANLPFTVLHHNVQSEFVDVNPSFLVAFNLFPFSDDAFNRHTKCSG